MPELDDKKLLELTDETLSWARNVADMWVGTPYQKQIDVQVQTIEKSLEHKDLKKVRAFVFDLARFLDEAERSYDGE